MRNVLARVATLTRKIAEWLVPVLSAIKLLIEIVGKVANCHDHKLRLQVPITREVVFCTQRKVRTARRPYVGLL
jgi:hypothetical protein